MSRKSANHNLTSLVMVATRLNELCHEVVFVGGSIIGLLITDPAAPDVRYTLDIDCIVNVFTKISYHQFSKKLRQKGFKELLFGEHPICRWDCDGVLIDIVPTEKSVLGFSNRWYKDAAVFAVDTRLNESITVKVISAAYFLATKLEAFSDRGKDDFLISHDLEDIISVIDGRPEIIEDVATASHEVKHYLSSKFASFLHTSKFLDALPGHLNYTTEYEDRKRIVLQRINAIAQLKA